MDDRLHRLLFDLSAEERKEDLGRIIAGIGLGLAAVSLAVTDPVRGFLLLLWGIGFSVVGTYMLACIWHRSRIMGLLLGFFPGLGLLALAYLRDMKIAMLRRRRPGRMTHRAKRLSSVFTPLQRLGSGLIVVAAVTHITVMSTGGLAALDDEVILILLTAVFGPPLVLNWRIREVWMEGRCLIVRCSDAWFRRVPLSLIDSLSPGGILAGSTVDVCFRQPTAVGEGMVFSVLGDPDDTVEWLAKQANMAQEIEARPPPRSARAAPLTDDDQEE